MAKRVAYLTLEVPYPPRSGDRYRRLHLLRSYVEAGYDVSLISLCRDAEEARWAETLRHYCKEIHLIPFQSTVGFRIQASPKPLVWGRVLGSVLPWSVRRYYSPVMHAAVAHARASCDVVHCARIALVPYVPSRNGLPSLSQRLVLDMDEVESVVKQRELQADLIRGLGRKLLWRSEIAKVKLLERRVLDWFDLVFVCSEIDRRRLDASNVIVVPNGTELPSGEVEVGEGDGRTILFVGGLGYPPNRDAVHYFVTCILPLVRQAVPEARFVVVGRDCDDQIRGFHNGLSVEIVGEVEKIDPYYREASVVVAPLRVGGGTRVKILEAFGWGRPVVATSIGAEGIPVRSGEELFLEDEPEPFADRCVELLRNRSLRLSIAVKGKEFVKAYDWARLRTQTAEIVARLR